MHQVLRITNIFPSVYYYKKLSANESKHCMLFKIREDYRGYYDDFIIYISISFWNIFLPPEVVPEMSKHQVNTDAEAVFMFEDICRVINLKLTANNNCHL